MMTSTAKMAAVSLLALFLSNAASTEAQTTNNTSTQKTTAPGAILFNQYCAVCHGKDAKGNGPAAAALKVPPPDLTTLARRHGGKYPTDYVANVLQYGTEGLTAHGSKDMPVWGSALSPSGALSQSPSQPLGQARQVDASVAQKIHDLSSYMESLQVK